MIISLGNWQELCTFVPKCAKNTCVFNSFWTFDSMFDHKWVWSLSKLCSVQHCKAGWARPVFSILGKDKRDPNETVFCSLDVSQGLHFKAVQSNRSYRIWDCFYLNEPLENMQKHRVLSSVASPNELCGQPQSAGDRSQTGVMGWKKGVGVGRESCFLGNFVVFYRKNAFPVPTPVQIEAIVSESVCFTNCFYLKRTRLHMDLGLLLFEKNIEYLLK